MKQNLLSSSSSKMQLEEVYGTKQTMLRKNKNIISSQRVTSSAFQKNDKRQKSYERKQTNKSFNNQDKLLKLRQSLYPKVFSQKQRLTSAWSTCASHAALVISSKQFNVESETERSSSSQRQLSQNVTRGQDYDKEIAIKVAKLSSTDDQRAINNDLVFNAKRQV